MSHPPASVIRVAVEAVQLDERATDAADAIRVAGRPLLTAEWVTPAYIRAVVAREDENPTGLPTLPEPVAVPHAGPDGVRVPCIAFLRLQEPVPFVQMATRDTPLPVRLVFLLALSSKDQARVLSALLRGLRDLDLLSFLLAERSAKAVADRLATVIEQGATDG